MTKKGKRTALLQRTEQIAELQRENEQLKARLAAPEMSDEKLRQSESATGCMRRRGSGRDSGTS